MNTWDFTRCQRPNGTFYGTAGQCRKGDEVGDREDIDTSMIGKGVALSDSDLDAMEKTWAEYQRTGQLEFPFKIPKEYDDNSGTPEACDELVSLRDKLKTDVKTGRITIPDGVKVSDRARQLVDEWNSLDLSTVYVNSSQGNKLNVSGLGVMAGPRDSVPKDAMRGLIQYVGLRRQDADLIDTPNGKVIDSYRDPFTGKRRPFMGDTGKAELDVVASQDHWNRPFGIYGIKSENDVRNTVYMPISMNVAKGEASPARYVYQSLVSAGRIQGSPSADRTALGGFAGRYDKDSKLDFLPKGQTRDSEKAALAENSKWMLDRASRDIDEKYIPKISKALEKGKVDDKTTTDLVYSIAKQESKRNYFGGLLRFSEGQRIFTQYEQQLLKGIDLNSDTGALKAAITQRIAEDPDSNEIILSKILAGRK
jgi:hypothetical protein